MHWPLTWWISVGDGLSPVSETGLVRALSLEAQGLPVAQHLAPRPTKPGTLDLTASTLFVRSVEQHARICNYARQLNKLVSFRHAQINLGAALEMFLRALHGVHSLWSQKTLLTPTDLNQAGLARRGMSHPILERQMFLTGSFRSRPGRVTLHL